LQLARAALQAGANGFLHAQMPPEQVVRALEVASKGEHVVPRELLKALAEAPVDPDPRGAQPEPGCERPSQEHLTHGLPLPDQTLATTPVGLAVRIAAKVMAYT
jgi:DNA-binding NarL/FixJ family response regulator